MRKIYEKSVSDSDRALSMNFEKVTDTLTFDTMSTEFILFYQKITKELKKNNDKTPPELVAETDENMELRVPEKSHQKLLETISAMGKISDGLASPAHSRPEGEGLTVCVHKTKDEPMIGTFIVRSFDKDNHAKKRGGDEIKVILKQQQLDKRRSVRAGDGDHERINKEEEKAFVSSVVDNNDGIYTINYTVNSPDLVGEQEMSVLMNGEHVVGSPFRVMFVRKYQRLSNNDMRLGGGSSAESKSDRDLLRPTSPLHNNNYALVPASVAAVPATPSSGGGINKLVSGSNMEISQNGTKAVATLNVAYCKLQYPLNDSHKVTFRRTKGGNPDIGYCDIAVFDSPNIPNTFAANGHIQGSKIFWRIWNGEFYYNGKLVSTNVHGQYQGQAESCKVSVQYNQTKMTFYFNDVLVHSFNVQSSETFYLYIRPYYQNSTIELLN
jgi:archaellum component FlaF (FlaF/FlaG flagellin family)